MEISKQKTIQLKNKLIISVMLILISSCATQKILIPIKDAVYLDKYEAEITDIRKARSYRIITRDSVDKNLAVAKTYFISGKQKSEIKLANEATLADRQWKPNHNRFMLMDIDDKTLWAFNGKYTELYENGKPKKIIQYKNGYRVNRLVTFWENEKIRRTEKYDDNSNFLFGECYDKSGKVIPFTKYSTDAYFGNLGYRSENQFLQNTVHYPKPALEYKDAGTVLIYHYLDGRGRNFKNLIRYSLNPVLDAEALRVVNKMADFFNPATQDDEPCAFVKLIPIRFNLPAFAIDLIKNANPTDSVYFDKTGFIKKNRTQAETIELFRPAENNSNLIIRTIYNMRGNKLSEITIDKNKTIRNFETAYPNIYENTLTSSKMDINKYQVAEGQSIGWYDNGNIKQKSIFENGKFAKPTEYFNLDGSSIEISNKENSKVYSVVEKMAMFPGGESELTYFVSRNIRFPVKAQEERISGLEIVKFVVLEDGTIGDIQIIRSLSPEIDAEAKRVIRLLPNFIPGSQNGKNVPVWYTLPITFKNI